MSELAMTVAEREDFLAGVHIGVLGVERPGGPPLLTPVWYRVTDGVVELNTARRSLKADLLAAAGRATMTVQREQLPYAYVSVEGPIQLVETSYEARVDIAVRYLGEAMGNAYVGTTLEVDDIMVRLTVERWRTCDYAKLEPG